MVLLNDVRKLNEVSYFGPEKKRSRVAFSGLNFSIIKKVGKNLTRHKLASPFLVHLTIFGLASSLEVFISLIKSVASMASLE